MASAVANRSCKSVCDDMSMLQGDFSQNLKMLQKYPPVDVHEILLQAANL